MKEQQMLCYIWKVSCDHITELVASKTGIGLFSLGRGYIFVSHSLVSVLPEFLYQFTGLSECDRSYWYYFYIIYYTLFILLGIIYILI
jgi:hypothetical protein